MSDNIYEYITKLTFKRCGIRYKYYADDIIQEVLIKVYTENIEDLLLINHWIVYYLNKEKRQSIKKVSLTYKHDLIEETIIFNSSKLRDLFSLFLVEKKIKNKWVEIFIKVKFEKIKYKDLKINNVNVASVYVSRLYKQFRNFLLSKKIKLEDFYE